jgi:hypothetical protein
VQAGRYPRVEGGLSSQQHLPIVYLAKFMLHVAPRERQTLTSSLSPLTAPFIPAILTLAPLFIIRIVRRVAIPLPLWLAVARTGK